VLRAETFPFIDERPQPNTPFIVNNMTYSRDNKGQIQDENTHNLSNTKFTLAMTNDMTYKGGSQVIVNMNIINV